MISQDVFRSVVSGTLGGLMVEHGFSPDCSADYMATFRSASHVLRVDYDARYSRELSIWFDEVGKFRSPLGLGDLLRAAGCPESNVGAVEAAQPDDERALRAVLERAERLLRRHGMPYLTENPLAFVHAEEVRRERERESEIRARRARPQAKADAAWQKKDYETVRRLLAPMREILDPVHRRRLSYAEKRCTTDSPPHRADSS